MDTDKRVTTALLVRAAHAFCSSLSLALSSRLSSALRPVLLLPGWPCRSLLSLLLFGLLIFHLAVEQGGRTAAGPDADAAAVDALGSHSRDMPSRGHAGAAVLPRHGPQLLDALDRHAREEKGRPECSGDAPEQLLSAPSSPLFLLSSRPATPSGNVPATVSASCAGPLSRRRWARCPARPGRRVPARPARVSAR